MLWPLYPRGKSPHYALDMWYHLEGKPMGIIYYSNGPYANVLLVCYKGKGMSPVYILEYSTRSFGDIGGTHGMMMALSMAVFTVCGSTLRF
jgi:hypothetical protein